VNRIILAALALALIPAAAIAAEVATVGNTAVILPWGDIVVALAQPLLYVLGCAIAASVLALMRKYAPWLEQRISKQELEASLQRIEDFGLNATAGALKGKTLSYDVGSAALARMVQYGANNASPLIIKAAGGLPGLTEKLFRRMNLDEGADAATVLHPVLDQVNAGAIGKPS